MDDALLVRSFERGRDLLCEHKCFVERNRFSRDALSKRLAIDQLHHDGIFAVGFFETVDLCDAWMVERCENFRLTLESSQALSVGGERLRQYLDCDVALQSDVAGAIDLAHPPFIDEGEN